MTRKPELTQEEQRLRQATREAHETLQALNDTLKEARALIPALTTQFEQHADSEIKSLSNYVITEGNRISTELNRQISEARDLILDALQYTILHPNQDFTELQVTWPDITFSDQEPLPYPNHPIKKDTP